MSSTFKAILAVALLIALPAAGQTPNRSNAYSTSTDAQKIGWMQKGMDAVKSKLKDPGSAEFSNVYFNRGREGIPVTCGSVNAKNSFGGRSGIQKFISAGRPELTFLEEETQDFSVSWDKFCN